MISVLVGYNYAVYRVPVTRESDLVDACVLQICRLSAAARFITNVHGCHEFHSCAGRVAVGLVLLAARRR